MNERQQAAAEAKAELSYGQALWYAWGRIDSGEYKSKGFPPPDAFTFAETVKTATLAFELEQTHYLDSIQGAWQKFVEEELP